MTKRRNLRRRILRQSSRSLHHETLEKRELLAAEFGAQADGPRLISVAANSGEQFDLDANNLLNVAPTELTFRFDGAQPLDPATLSAIQFRASGGDGSFDDGNERTIIPGFLGFADDGVSRVVVARFQESLPDDQYVIEVAGFDDTDPLAPVIGLRNTNGDLFCPPGSAGQERPVQSIFMDIEVGPRVVAIVPQPIVVVGGVRDRLENTIHVYFNNDPLSNPNAGPINNTTSTLSVVNPQFYKLLYTQDTVENTDDGAPFLPVSVSYDPALNRATLTFASDLSQLAPAAANNGAGTFRLRVGSGDPLPAPPTLVNGAADAGDTFAAAAPLGTTFGNGLQSVQVTGGVIQASKDVIPHWPGAYQAPGLRDYRRDAPLVGRVDTQTGINVYEYNFANLYGLDPQLNKLNNAITPAQRQRTREILGLFAERLGVEFVETQNRGLQIVTGDIRALAVSADTGIETPYSLFRVNDADPSQGVLVMDAGQNWYDDYGLSPDSRPSWFVEALRGVGSLLGIGNTFELPAGDASGGSSPDEPNSLLFTVPDPNLPLEPDFLTQGNVITGQALHRPENDDVDFYHFRATTNGRVTLETFAQRLEASSNLDTHLKLYQVVDAAAGRYELVASNDDFFSDDSFLSIDLRLPVDAAGNPVATDYIIGVSAAGNDAYNGQVSGSGLGGVTEGAYELRVTFDSDVGLTITDTNGSALDGDADGRAGGDFNFWFRVARDTATPAANEPRVIFVDKLGGDDFLNNGTLAGPLKTVAAAFAAARAGDIVRLLPNGGVDGLISTTGDNRPYEIGFGGSGNGRLADGGDFEVPKGVTVMIDAGAILKLRSAKISVGSESVDEDRSLAALQILGTPTSPRSALGAPLADEMGSVFFTSFDDATLGVDNNPLNVPPQPGNWAGIEFRNDFDYAEGRAVWETEGIFLDYSSHANIRYGGGSISPTAPVVNALQMAEARPTLIHNVLTDNADAAISADPNSFLETNFHEPRFQRVAGFTSDYNRVGPEIYGNVLARNSTNGLFVRVVTPAAGQLRPMTVSGRFDDREIVHVLSQVLVLQGQPGGSLLLEQKPDVLNVTLGNASGGTLTVGSFYDYRVTFVTAEGRESLASNPTTMKQAPLGGAIALNGLPEAPTAFAGRRLYRLQPATGRYEFVAQLDRGTRAYTDDGSTRGGELPAAALASSRLLPRFDARLSIDPGLIVKLENSRIETSFGADFYAEGVDGDPVIFTSRSDDRFGAGGTFNTNNNADTPSPGDWGGLVFRQDSIASLDYVQIQYAGGTTPIEGGFTEFNPIEILQADVRIAHSTIRDNADGFIAASVRGGRGFNGPATIFIRGSEPIIVDNTIVANEGAAISVNADALGYNDVLDTGRSTGAVDIVATDQDNQGPLISGNRLDRNGLNGMLVRNEILQGESVWDDTDIVHIVNGEIRTVSHHHRGGLRLKSDANQSLVVKFGPNGKLVGSGRPLDIDDRIGGTLQIIGQGGFPVILTSLADDSVGAGFTPDGIAQTNTDNANIIPAAGNWDGIELLSYVNDRNVGFVVESERAISAAINQNAIADNAQVIGDLAAHEYAGDETERLGFNIRGTLANPQDVDVYRFTANGGTVVYIDIDDTSFGLDTIVELIDVNNQVLARSDNSFAEATNPGLLVNNLPPGSVLPLFLNGTVNVESPNSLDAGMRVILDGTGPDNTYYVRVRSAGALSSGQYQLSIRLREREEIAGSTIQLADIRFATDAITVSGAPLHSPLAGDSTERLDYLPDGTPVDVDTARLTFTEANSTRLGNLLTSDRGSLRVSGSIGNIDPSLAFEPSDEIDVYQVDLFVQQIEPDVFDSENRFVTATFDVDYADQLGRVNTSLAIYDAAGRVILHSRDSNIADDVGRPLRGDDPTNLSGGSVGVLDAHIGPVELPEGTYYVAVSSEIAVPSALDQFFLPAPTATNVRLMPINSIRRIADDTLEGAGVGFVIGDQYTADRPIIEPLFDANSIVPFKLDDVRLFVSYANGIGGGNRSSLASFNPFTGVMDRLIGQSGQPTADIAARRDGELFSYSLGPQSGPEDNGNVGNFLNISPANGAATQAGDDGVTFQRNNQAGDDLENDDNAQLDILAMTFPLQDGSSINGNQVNDTERFFLVGRRDNQGRGGEIPLEYTRNIFYTAVSSNGEITSRGSTDPNFHRNFNGTIPYFPSSGAASPDREWGFVDTGAFFGGGDGGDITGLAVDPSDATSMIGVTDRGGVHVFDYTLTVQGPGDFFTRANNIIPTNYFGQLTPDPRDFASQARGFVEFQGLAYGPRQIEGQAYRDVLFGVSSEGWLYAFKFDNGAVVPANVFVDGRSAIQLTFEGGSAAGGVRPNGLAFSILEQNPWHFTGDRGNQTDHGIEIPYDRSRVGVLGGTSLYFGFEIDGNAANNTVSRDDGDPLGEISPGGTQGTVISNPFSLEGYSPSDKPTLYFTYFLEVEADDDYVPGSRRQNDSFRAYAAGDDGKWLLLATNNDFRQLPASDEYDHYDTTEIPVQELFDDSNAWRQARVDLSPLAGNENVRIRFDFSTAGAMRHQFGSIELVAVDGDKITDRETVELRDSSFRTVRLENIVGKDVLVPGGGRLANGDQFTVVGPAGPFTITFVTGPVTAPGQVRFTPSDTAATVAAAVVAALPKTLRPYAEGNGRISLLAATDVIVPGDSPVGQSNPVQVTLTADQLVVPDGVNLASGEEFTVVGGGTTTRIVLVEAADVTGDPDELIFASTDTAVTIASAIIARLPDVLDAILEKDGRITFINSPVTLTFVAPDAINDLRQRDVIENRLELILPNGNALVDGNQLTIRGISGDTVITFVLNTVPEGPGTVHFSPGDTANDIATRLAAQLPASMDALFNLAGNGLLLLADDAFGGFGVLDRPIGAEAITLPAGTVPLRNDNITLIDSLGNNILINFVETALATAPIPAIGVNPGTVFYRVTDTPDVIAANFELAIANFFVTINQGDTILALGCLDSFTTDPDTMIINDATLGQFIRLPATGAGLIDGGEQVLIRSPFGDVVVRFVEQAFATGPNDVFYADGDSAAVIQSRLQAALPTNLRAIVTNTGTSGNVVQILGATDIIPLNPASLILTGPNAYARSVLNLDIKDGNQIRNGEQIVINVGFNSETITFVRRGSTSTAVGTIQIFYDDTDLASDLYDQIVTALPQNFEVYIDLNNDGVNVGARNATAIVLDGVAALRESSIDIDEFAIPITLPGGAELINGEQIRIIAKDDLTGSSPITITFRLGVSAPLPGEVRYTLADTPTDIARKLQDALPLPLQSYIASPRELYLLNASSVSTDPGSAIISFQLAPGAVPVQVNSTMSSEQVAMVLQSSLAEAFGRLATTDGSNFATAGNYTIIGGDRIRLYNALAVDSGPYGVSSHSTTFPDPIDAFSTFSSSALPAEFFGEARPTGFATNQIDGQGGANNNIEGVYIDDIIVGFAERGEMVLNAPAGNRNFVLNPEVIPDSRPEAVQPEKQNETLTGPYALEIRTSDQYGVPEDFDPINLQLDELFASGRSFDTNDRLVDGAVTLFAQPGLSLVDGDRFVLSDGTRQLTFEFDSLLAPGVISGNVAVPFDPSGDRAQEVARAIRDAINSPQARDVLQITAATSDSLEVGPTSGVMVELFGPSIRVNPGGGRFIKMDLVAEETFLGRETSKLVPVVDHVNQTVTYVSPGDQQARAAVSGFADGTMDVLVADGKIGDQVHTGEIVDDAPRILFSDPSEDVDYVRIYLRAGQTIDIDVDSVGLARGAEILDLPVITVLDGTGATATNAINGLPAQTSLVATSQAPGEFHPGAFLKFRAAADAYYDVAISSSPFFFGGGFFFGDFGEYQLTIRPDAATSAAIPDRDVVQAEYHFGKGDVNRIQDQGQIIITSNFISDTSGAGVLATAGPRGQALASNGNVVVADNNPRPGSVNLLRNINTDMLVPGAVISNNVVVNARAGGIVVSGGTANGGQAPAPVPYARVVNNTVVGNGSGSGIVVASNASPTLLNNLISGFAIGVNVDGSSALATVLGSNAFHNNALNSTIPLSAGAQIIVGPVFQDPARRIFIPVDESVVIDSSVSSLPDRSDFFITVKNPVGISASPIIAPLFDAYGQPRFDDPDINPPGASGQVVTIDRGAIDRADRTSPVAELTGPQDAIGNVVPDGDRDPDESFVRLAQGTVEFFEVQLLDPAGTGPDKDTITPESVLLTENGRRLIPDVDFIFGYSDNSRTIRLTPLAGLWRPDAVYEITLNNQQRIQYEVPSGDQISDGDQIVLTDTAGNESVFEFESGYSLQVPQTTLLTVTGTNASFRDRDTFRITAPSGNALAFEINLTGATAGGNIPIELSGATTIREVRDTILSALQGQLPSNPLVSIKQFLDIDPVAVGSSQIQLGTLAGHVQPAPIRGLTVSGQAGGVADGDTFTYTTATASVTFEFDSNLTPNDASREIISFTRTETPGDIARKIVTALQGVSLGLGGATAVDDGTVVLGGVVGDVLVVDQAAPVLTGAPGVTGSLTLTIPAAETGASIDGSTFSIDVDGTAVTFRYTTDPTLTSSDRLILLNPTDLVNGIAARTAAVIALTFPDELSPTASGDTVTLGEQAAIPPAGQPASLTRVDGGTAGLVVGGVSGGAIAVSYLPTSPQTSIAATIQGAIEDSPLSVTTFSPGGGTILISGARSLVVVTDGNPPQNVGVLTPAIADLAGNAVRETRLNNETRFTIIMPDVVFDLGDAPPSYGTLFADNGPRHTVNDAQLPRLGQFVDTEADALVINQDDTPLDVDVTQTPALGIFTIDAFTIADTDRITVNSLPSGGETLTVTVNLLARTFELVEISSNPTGSNVPVTFNSTDTIEEITTRLVNAIRTELARLSDGLFVSQDSATSLVITAVDDEDGVALGVFSDGVANYNVFILPGTDPNNIQATDVLGFLNPQDPAGTNIAVNIRGAGLLHAWIDFDRSGFFEDDEQVLSNVPVSGDADTGTFNFVTVFTPSDAIDGATWMRVRISESGNLRPTGVAVGGEVEDYPVEIISIPLPVPVDDVYSINEDATLDTLGQSLPSLEGTPPNQDFIPPQSFLPAQFIAGRLPLNGTLVSLDATTGHFVYQPNPDFNGVDTFTYRLSTQQNAGAGTVALDSFATVTINVAAVNDVPGGANQGFTAQEDLPLTITAGQLLSGAAGDADPRYQSPTNDPLSLQNETLLNEINQLASLTITSLRGSGTTPITAANAAAGAGSLQVTTVGRGLNIQVTSATAGDLISLSFGGLTQTFQLVPVGGSAQAGTIPVQLLSGDSTGAIAARLTAAIDSVFAATTPPVVSTQLGNTVSLAFTPLTVSGSASSTFTITPTAGGLTIDVVGTPRPTAPPTPAVPNPPVGDTVTINVGGTVRTFELISVGAIATGSNIPITVLPFQDPTSPAARAAVAAQLAAAIQAQLQSADLGAVARIVDGTTNPRRVTIEPARITAGKSFATARGSAIAVFDSLGALIELRYISAQDLNRDNPPPATPLHVDQFTYTVGDNGVSIDLVNNRFVYGTPQASAAVTTTIDVAPQNDPPLLVADEVTVGPLGPAAAGVVTAWEMFGGGTPTEDQSLTIDPAFLLANDSRGPLSAGDENTLTSLNDTGLTVTAVSMVDPSQGTVQLQGGMIIFTPAANIFGDVLFNYSARDRGINEELDGMRPVVPLTSTNGVVTVTIQPVNDIPVAFNRALTYSESNAPGPGPDFVFTRNQLILGSGGEVPAAPGSFAPTLPAPFNESEQTLRVVSFTTLAGTVDASSLSGSGLQTLTLASDGGGLFEFDFFNGVFTVGRFTSTDDYNRRPPFAAAETFIYVIADDGLTTSPQGGSQFNLPSARSDDNPLAPRATVSITILETNDAPTFDFDAPLVAGLPTINILERDDNLGTVIDDFAINILPGPPGALDETALQSVVFSFPAGMNGAPNVPAGLFTQPPQLTPAGRLTLFPAPDQIGSATFVVVAQDMEPGTVGFVPRQTIKTFVVNVQPVNDAPRFDPTVAGTSDSAGPDEAYDVASDDINGDGRIDNAAITYTLREDNTQAMGVIAPYFIPLRAAPAAGYSRLGLLDVFTVGPDNEAAALPGGSQIVEFLQAGNPPVSPSLDRTTDRGGRLVPVFDSNSVLIGLSYTPPLDFNVAFAGRDSFSYTVRDDSLSGGETFSLAAGALVPDRLTTVNTVELVLNPVNDRPQFSTETLNISVREDGAEVMFNSYASNISAGPPNTAFDEVDVTTGQLVAFTVTSLDFPREDAANFFSVYPTINEQSGLLRFRSAPNVFGDFRFELVLTDRNRDGSISDNTLRGDLISSIPVTLTISVQPINDPPIVDPNADPLAFELLEDGSIEILVTGDNTSPGLLDPFLPGPSGGATDEAADIAPEIGGNQTVSLGTPIPTTSAEGGTIQFVMSGGTPRLRYTPRPNYVGPDSFIYTVIDNGVTVGIDGQPFSDPRIASNTVTFQVLPVNDAPLFSGAANVQSLEDAGVVMISNWATNLQAGPSTAVDEINGLGSTPPQTMQFVFTQTSSNTALFRTPPTAVINSQTGTATLMYEARENANGVATFSVVLEDFGPRDASIGDQFRSSPPRVFSISVGAVNDPPSFDLANALITRPEDSGPFNVTQAINISPGPLDEQSQTVVFEIETLPPQFASLFAEPPTINSEGLLRFTTATNQNTDNLNGPAVIRVIARDSAGGQSAAAEFRIAITEVNDPPRAVSDEFDTDEDRVLVISEDQLKANDVDPDLISNASEDVRVVMPAQSFSVNGASVSFNATTGQITYDPTGSLALQSLPPNQSRVDSFSYSLIDAAGSRSNLVTVALNVAGINDAPIVNIDTPQLNPDGPTVIPVLDNDIDVDGTIIPSSILIALQPAFGSVARQPNGTLVYSPFSSFTDEDIFSYTVADNLGLRSQEVFVTISANASPIAVNDARGTFLDEAVVIPVSANDSDPDGTLNLASIVIVTQPQRGEAIPLGDGSVRYLPDPGFLGRDSFQYRIADNQGRLSNVATVNTQVVASRLQNPDDPADVNDNGDVTALDALLVINRMAQEDGATSIPVLPTDRGPNFYDVNGNQQISAADALRVINELRRESDGGETEQLLAPVANPTHSADPAVIAPPAPLDLAGAVKIVDTSAIPWVSEEVVDLLAARRDSEASSESVVDAIDAAMADLL